MERDDRVGGGGRCEGPGWRVRGSSPVLGFVSGPVGSAVSATSPHHAVSEDAVRFSDLKLRGGGEADINGGHQLVGGD